MSPQELRTRFKAYAYRCIRVAEALPVDNIASSVIKKQLIRSAFSGANNYRAATRAQSDGQFLAKLNIALEEVDESLDWLESISDLRLLPIEKLNLI